MKADDLYCYIGEKVSIWRAKAGLSQKTLAEKVGMTRPSIANLESGKQRMPVHLLYRVAAELGVRIADILPAEAALPERKKDIVDELSMEIHALLAQRLRRK